MLLVDLEMDRACVGNASSLGLVGIILIQELETVNLKKCPWSDSVVLVAACDDDFADVSMHLILLIFFC